MRKIIFKIKAYQRSQHSVGITVYFSKLIPAKPHYSPLPLNTVYQNIDCPYIS